MATVAEQLRTAREARQLSVNQVAEITKIRTDHVRALEEGNFDVFSAPVYIRGFTRTYATLLKLEVPAVMAELDRELDHTEKFSEPPSLSRRENTVLDVVTLLLSRIRMRTVLGVLLALALLAALIAGIAAWQGRGEGDALNDVGEGMYRPAGRPGGETLPVPQPAPRR